MRDWSFTVLMWLLSFALLFGGTHLCAYGFGDDPNDVAGWVALGAVCVVLARKPR